MITVKHLQKSFSGIPVLRDVNVEIGKGEVISVIGPSGTGKSTLLRCLNLLERPDSGEIVVDGKNILLPGTNAAGLRAKMGMVFQQFNLFPHLTAEENIMLAPHSILKQSKAEARARARELLETVGLADKRNALPDELSGGQQQRIAVCRVLINDPEIILADEPTGALDSKTGLELMEIFRGFKKQGKTLVMVTHTPEVAKFADRIIYMRDGKVMDDNYKLKDYNY